MAAPSGRRYRWVRAALVVGALLPLIVAGFGRGEDASTAAPAANRAAPPRSGVDGTGQPAGPVSAGVAPGAVRLRLGRFDAPATGAVARSGVPDGVPLAGLRSLSLARDGLPPFRAVGVTWTGRADALGVAIRGRVGQGPWGPWLTAGPAGGFDDRKPGVRGGAQLVWLAASDSVQVTVTADSAADGAPDSAPDDVAVDLIDPREAPGDAVPVPSVNTVSVDATRVARPPIHSRAEWGADERLMSWAPRYAPAVRALAWHDQPVGGDYAEPDVPRLLRALYYYDAVSRGWGDLGDNVLVDRFGRLWEGRYGGLSRAVVGAHTPARNADTAGIGVLGGTGTAAPAAPPSALPQSAISPPAIEATARYVAWKLSIGPAVDPRGDTQLPSAGPTREPAPTGPVRLAASAAPVPAGAGAVSGGVAAPAVPVDGPAAKPAQPLAGRPADADNRPAGPVAPDRAESTRLPDRPGDVTNGGAVPGAAVPGAVPGAAAVRPGATGPKTGPKPAAGAKPATGARPAAGARPATATKATKPKTKAKTNVRTRAGSRVKAAKPARHFRYPKKAPVVATVTVPRVFAADLAVPAVPATVLPVVRDRAYALMGSWSRPETMRRTLAVWSPGRATFTELGQDAPVLTGQPGDEPVPADYDGDGELDAATWTPTTGVWTIHNSGGGTTERLVLGRRGDIAVPADYDGDGRADPATWTPKTGTWHVRGERDIRYGRAGDRPVPADYTGDGRADPAVYRDGVWQISGVGQIRLGEPWHIPVPADYDGDGKADPATWSTRSYRWFVRGRPPVSFGAPGDVPLPGQYDGDGRADFAVWHAGGWRIRGVGEYPIGTVGDIPTTLG